MSVNQISLGLPAQVLFIYVTAHKGYRRSRENLWLCLVPSLAPVSIGFGQIFQVWYGHSRDLSRIWPEVWSISSNPRLFTVQVRAIQYYNALNIGYATLYE